MIKWQLLLHNDKICSAGLWKHTHTHTHICFGQSILNVNTETGILSVYCYGIKTSLSNRKINTYRHTMESTDPNGRAAYDVGLWPLDYCDCGFESRWGHGCSSLCLLCECEQRPLRRADHSFRGVLPVVCVCVCVSNYVRSTYKLQ